MKKYYQRGLALVFVLFSAAVWAQPDLNVNTGSPYQFPGDGQVHFVEFFVNNDGDLIAGDGITIDIFLQDQLLQFEGTVLGDPLWDCAAIISDGSCTFQGALNAFGGSTTLEVGIITQPGDITFTPALSATVTDVGGVEVNLSDNDAFVDIQYSSGGVDLGLVKTLSASSPNNVQPGEAISFDITVSNPAGPDANNVVVIDDFLINDLIFDANSSSPECNDTGSVIQCSLLDLPTGDDFVFTLVGIVDINAQPGPKTNVADVSATETDPFPSNNSDSQAFTVSIGGTPEIEVFKSVVGGITQAAPGSSLDYEIQVRNTGVGDALNVDLQDTLPAGVQYQSHVELGPNFACTFTAPTLNCLAPTLPNTAAVDGVRITVQVTGNDGDTIINTASSTFFDSNSADNVDSAQFDVVAPTADLDIGIVPDQPVYTVGDLVTLDVTLHNPFASSAAPTDAVVTVSLPSQLVFNSAQVTNATGWLCTHDGSTVGGDVTCDSQGNPVPIGTNTFIQVLALADSDATGTGATATVTSGLDPNPSNDTDFGPFVVNPGDADLALFFTSTSGVYTQGDPISYEFLVENPMGSSANPTDVVVDVTLPPEVRFSNTDLVAAPGWSCNHDGSTNGGTVLCDRGGSPFISFTTHNFRINVVAVTPGTGVLVNANVASTADSNLLNNNDNQTDDINAGASDFSITKNVSGTNFAINDPFTYVLTIDNPVGSTASPVDVVVSDTLPNEVSFTGTIIGTALGTPFSCVHDGATNGGVLTCDTGGAPFAIGETVTVDINVTAAVASNNVNNSATVATAVDPDGTTGNNLGSAPTVVIAGGGATTLVATKSASVAGVPITELNYGQTFEYVLEVQNTGPVDALNVNVTDLIPADVTLNNTQSVGWACNPGPDIDCTLTAPLASGSTAQIVLDVTATNNTAVTSVTNQMSAIGTNTGAAVDDTLVLNFVTATASLNLAQNPSPVDPGAAVDFAVQVVNTGTGDLTGVQIDNLLPLGFVYVGFTADPGVSCAENAGMVNCIYTPTLTAGGTINLSIQTTAIASPVAGQSYTLDTTLDANELVAAVNASLTVVFSLSDVFVNLFSSVPQVALGTPFTQTISISNTGVFPLVNISSFYNVPSNITVLGASSSDFTCVPSSGVLTCTNSAPMLPNGNAIIEVDLLINSGSGVFSNNVTVNADGLIRTANDSVNIVGNARHDVALFKTAPVSEVGTNSPLSYVLEVLNVGSETQTAFAVSDALPAGMVLQDFVGAEWSCEGSTVVNCAFNGTLPSGQSSQLQLNVISPETPGSVTNTASVSLAGDENPDNDTSAVAVNVSQGGGGGVTRADLAVTIAPSASTVLNTDTIAWEIEVANMGPDTATNVQLTNPLPMGFVADSVQVGSGVNCTLLSMSLTCDILSLPNNQVQLIVLEGSFAAGFSGVIINDVEVMSDAIDSNPSNNQSTTQVTVNAVEDLDADLSLSLNVDQQDIQQGDTFELSFLASNQGPDLAVNARLNASLTGLIQNVQVLNAGGWACQVNNTSLSCAYPGNFMVGTASQIDLRVVTQQVVQTSQPIVFNASIESDSMDSQPGNNLASFSNEVRRTPTEEEIFALFDEAVGSGASDTVMQTIRNVSSYCARSYFMAIEGLCEELIAGARPDNRGDIINLMEEITPNEVTAQSTSAAEIITSQFRNVDSRLAQLRGGGGAGFSVNGLTARYGNESIPLGMLAYLNDDEEAAATSNINDFVSPWGMFVNGTISMGERDATGRELGFDFDTYGLTAGVDYRFSPTKVAGVALGYANFDSEIEGEAEVKSTGLTLTGYGSFYIKDNFYVDGRISYGNPDFEQKRRINFNLDNIAVDRVATGKTDSNQYSVAMSMGYHFNKNSWNITPNASVRYVKTSIDGFQETGAGGFNFAFADQEVKSMVWSVGTSVSKAISLKNGVLSPQFDINISRETENDGGFIEARFIDAPDDEIFFIATDEPDRTFGSAGLGLVFIGANGKQAYINYRSIFGLEGFTRGTINIGARFEF
ncbi:autotransporter domain-containing protein [Marinicella meishanensis]|uniref:autotransporter domain-containing protein n=1 Tax=Marinicella meishanensis TaxID=2873263 RepID=UPI001CBC6FCC|nr:autotransporter domain-containing protein [Marinicella sp. NBU2979]